MLVVDRYEDGRSRGFEDEVGVVFAASRVRELEQRWVVAGRGALQGFNCDLVAEMRRKGIV